MYIMGSMDKTHATLLREVKEKTGFTELRIAGELGISQPTVNRILKGQAEVMGSTMEAISAMHRKHCHRRRKTSSATLTET